MTGRDRACLAMVSRVSLDVLRHIPLYTGQMELDAIRFNHYFFLILTQVKSYYYFPKAYFFYAQCTFWLIFDTQPTLTTIFFYDFIYVFKPVIALISYQRTNVHQAHTFNSLLKYKTGHIFWLSMDYKKNSLQILNMAVGGHQTLPLIKIHIKSFPNGGE